VSRVRCGGVVECVCVVSWWRVLVACLCGVLGFDFKVCYVGVMCRCMLLTMCVVWVVK
jgi:hypothetical protein